MVKNGWDLSELDDLVRGLEGMGREMAEGADGFFRENRVGYVDVARQAARQYLLMTPPDDADPEVWAQRTDDFVELILARQAGDALEVFWRGREEGDDAPRREGRGISYDDVLRWVQAGAENGGKDKTAVENTRGRADERIAYDVYTAIRQYRLGFTGEKDYGPITERLERWMDLGKSAGAFLERLPGVLAAWENVLGPMMAADLEAWTEGLVRRWCER